MKNTETIVYIERRLQLIESKTGEDILAMDLPNQEYLVEQILPNGLFLIAGSPKIGKSWFVLQLGIAISNGSEFLGFNTSQSHVLYFCLEDTYQRIQNRLIDYEDELLGNIEFSTSSSKLDNGLIEELDSYITNHEDTKLIIIDTLQKIRNVRTDGYTYGQDYKEINILNEFVNRTGVSILLVHHLRKMKADDPFEEISGTTGIAGAVDGMYVMKKHRDIKNEVSLIATGRDMESFDLKLGFNNDSHRWELIDKSLEDEVIDEYVLNVIKLIEMIDFFYGTATELSELLREKLSYEVKGSALSKKLKKNIRILQEHNIEFKADRNSTQRSVSLRKLDVADDVSDGSDVNMYP